MQDHDGEQRPKSFTGQKWRPMYLKPVLSTWVEKHSPRTLLDRGRLWRRAGWTAMPFLQGEFTEVIMTQLSTNIVLTGHAARYIFIDFSEALDWVDYTTLLTKFVAIGLLFSNDLHCLMNFLTDSKLTWLVIRTQNILIWQQGTVCRPFYILLHWAGCCDMWTDNMAIGEIHFTDGTNIMLRATLYVVRWTHNNNIPILRIPATMTID